jgi:hypothetical protein
VDSCCGVLLLSELYFIGNSDEEFRKNFLKDIVKLCTKEWEYSQLIYYIVEEIQVSIKNALLEVGFRKVEGMDFFNKRSDNVVSVYTYHKEL